MEFWKSDLFIIVGNRTIFLLKNNYENIAHLWDLARIEKKTQFILKRAICPFAICKTDSEMMALVIKDWKKEVSE